jgi:prevent-host-death family protein
MTITIKVGEAKTHLSELLTKVEKGEDVVIARGNRAIARLVKISDRDTRKALVDLIRAERAARAAITSDDIRAWRDEGRR